MSYSKIKSETSSTALHFKSLFWFFNILIIYLILYLCIFFGEPFIAFDHINYINFLNSPNWNYFEPGYAFLSFVIHNIANEELRFKLMFMLATLIPLLLVTINYIDKKNINSYLGLMIFAFILIKSFYIGFVAQRFFFSELWLASLIIVYGSSSKIRLHNLIPGTFHFSALTIIPSLFFLNSKISFNKVFYSLICLILTIIYVNFFSDFKLLGFDYSRYLDPDNNLTKNPILSVFQIFILCCIALLSVKIPYAINIISLLFLVLLTKLLLGHFEVISRIFQIQCDLVIILIGLNAIKNHFLLYLYCIGFLLLQVFLSTNSSDMSFIFHNAFSNALSNF